jgi:SNF2 family DNA or RNA helicase
VNTYQIATRFPYLLQVVSDPSLLKGKILDDKFNDLLDDWEFGFNSKVPYCTELLYEHIDERNDKVIIWATNPETVEMLADYYSEYNPLFAHGKSTPKGITKEDYRNKLLNEFKTDPKRKLLIANDELFGTGENIEVANANIFWNLIFSYRRYYQALNRIDRPKQEKNMFIYKLFIDKTVDMIAEQVIDRKLELNDLKNNWEVLDRDETVKLLKGEI